MHKEYFKRYSNRTFSFLFFSCNVWFYSILLIFYIIYENVCVCVCSQHFHMEMWSDTNINIQTNFFPKYPSTHISDSFIDYTLLFWRQWNQWFSKKNHWHEWILEPIESTEHKRTHIKHVKSHLIKLHLIESYLILLNISLVLHAKY